MSETRARCHIDAPPMRVYQALIDPDAIVRWKVPGGMSASVDEFDGTSYRISLTYDAPDRTGKTSAHTDTYRGRFVELVPGEKVVEVDEFETSDPDLQGAMTITVTLTESAGGTDLHALHEGLPRGVRPADNELGWRESLARLANLVEGE